MYGYTHTHIYKYIIYIYIYKYITYEFAEAFFQDVTHPLFAGNKFKFIRKLFSQASAPFAMQILFTSKPLFAVFGFYIAMRYQICSVHTALSHAMYAEADLITFSLFWNWQAAWYITHCQCKRDASWILSTERNRRYDEIAHQPSSCCEICPQ